MKIENGRKDRVWRQPDQSHRCPHEETLHSQPSKNSFSEDYDQIVRSAQSDQNLRWAYMVGGTFSHFAAYLI